MPAKKKTTKKKPVTSEAPIKVPEPRTLLEQIAQEITNIGEAWANIGDIAARESTRLGR